MSSLNSYAGSSTYRDMLNVYDHILDPNERRRLLLAEIDKLPAEMEIELLGREADYVVVGLVRLRQK